jgi:hypothetical protein
MNQVGQIGPKDLSAFAFPPAPEKVEGRRRLEELAAAREDDILYGGTFRTDDMASAMMTVNEAVQLYTGMYQAVAGQTAQNVAGGAEPKGLGVSEVLYGLMSEEDKLGELTKLVGKLRFALEGGEAALSREAEEDIRLLARHLPEIHQVNRLVEVAKASGGHSARVTDLLLQRCFLLVHQDYIKLGQVEGEIKALEADP